MSQFHTSTLKANEFLRQERLLHGLTQAEVAGHIGTDGYTVNRWERGRAQPSLYFRKKLCNLFGKNAIELGFLSPVKEGDANTSALFPGDHPAPWLVPYPRNPLFTGRENVLQQLHNQFFTEARGTSSLALYGSGGIGKTEIALEYAYRHASKYSATFWMRAETAKHLMTSFSNIADVLCLREREKRDQQHTVIAVQHWLITHPAWLLIVDNVKHVDVLTPLLPLSRSGSILYTTRHPSLETLAQVVKIEALTREESIQFLLHRIYQSAEQQLSDAEKHAVNVLAEALGGLPLTLDQAGACIRLLDQYQIPAESAENILKCAAQYLRVRTQDDPTRER